MVNEGLQEVLHTAARGERVTCILLNNGVFGETGGHMTATTVLGQRTKNTIEGRDVHSLHAYFLRAGDVTAPIVYDVDLARDGRSFSNRRVVAIQHGRPIFNMTASFQIPEQGLEHQATSPDVPGPDELQDLADTPDEVLENLPEKMRRYLTRKRPFEIRPVEPVSLLSLEPSEPVRHVWMRAVERLPDQPHLHDRVFRQWQIKNANRRRH